MFSTMIPVPRFGLVLFNMFCMIGVYKGTQGAVISLEWIENAQINPETPDSILSTPKPEEGIRYKLNGSGTRYIQITFLNQVWLRRNQNNPGTTVEGLPQDISCDIGLRRTRMQLLAQLTDRVFFNLQYGQNNFNSQYALGATENRRHSCTMPFANTESALRIN